MVTDGNAIVSLYSTSRLTLVGFDQSNIIFRYKMYASTALEPRKQSSHKILAQKSIKIVGNHIAKAFVWPPINLSKN